jgi:hypothetical protein
LTLVSVKVHFLLILSLNWSQHWRMDWFKLWFLEFLSWLLLFWVLALDFLQVGVPAGLLEFSSLFRLFFLNVFSHSHLWISIKPLIIMRFWIKTTLILFESIILVVLRGFINSLKRFIGYLLGLLLILLLLLWINWFSICV